VPPSLQPRDRVRAALAARLLEVARLRSGEPATSPTRSGEAAVSAVTAPVAAAPPDHEAALRILMVRVLPRAARGQSGAMRQCIEHVLALSDVGDDPWLRFIDAWNSVFELAVRNHASLDASAFQTFLAGYETALNQSLHRLS
jgi:hypothetical protein